MTCIFYSVKWSQYEAFAISVRLIGFLHSPLLPAVHVGIQTRRYRLRPVHRALGSGFLLRPIAYIHVSVSRHCLHGCRYLEIVRNKISDTPSMYIVATDSCPLAIYTPSLEIKKKAPGCHLWPFLYESIFYN